MIIILLAAVHSAGGQVGPVTEQLRRGFVNPPDSVRPGVYWYFMDGNISARGMTEDLESMKKAGIGSVIFLEVNVGIPRGPVTFLSEEWQELFTHAVRECERLGITLTLGSGPGWAGSGGPWVTPEQSMQHLVSADTTVSGPARISLRLPIPRPVKPYFGYGTLTDSLKARWEAYYRDVAVLAFPTPARGTKIPDIEEKALFYRAPFSSVKGVRASFASTAGYPADSNGSVIPKELVKNLTGNMNQASVLTWDVPPGNWTIRRLGLRNNGAVTRPAPMPGLGFECDKMDTAAFNFHYNAFIGKLLKKTGISRLPGGWKMIHIDSWEMGAQNWTGAFREEFTRRRGYDPLPYLPSYAGDVVGSREISERFLWDVRLTAQELVVENHAAHFRQLGRKSGFRLSIEPYDMNPTSDLVLGSEADVPMCEFWSRKYGFNTSFSSIEASSIAHVMGKPVVQAEAFTAQNSEGWKLYPGAIKDQGDWAFAAGINKFFYHTFAHQPLDDKLKPGMTMGPYGVHWDRNQTWWNMSEAYHTYIARCSYLLQQGRHSADILYLAPEGAPHVFRPPLSATSGNDTLPDRKGYNFDGCSPEQLMRYATVKNHLICFPGGATYRLLVLPQVETMTPVLLSKIESLIMEGAMVEGRPPLKSPSLVNYPACDEAVQKIVRRLWKNSPEAAINGEISFGKGTLYCGPTPTVIDTSRPFPSYEESARILQKMKIPEDFVSDAPVRYAHRILKDADLWFVSNRTSEAFTATCNFRIGNGSPELWNPLTGQSQPMEVVARTNGTTTLKIPFAASQSFFVVFDRLKNISRKPQTAPGNKTCLATLDGPWKVYFDPAWGGPGEVGFPTLTDWTTHQDKGIRYYSGKAVYRKHFRLGKESLQNHHSLLLDLGEVNCLAQVSLNGKMLGTLWTTPWALEIGAAAKEGDNQLEIEVVNLWPNRLTGDEQYADDGISNRQWPGWLRENKSRTSQRFTFATYHFYKKDSPLLKSGMTGPVKIWEQENSGR